MEERNLYDSRQDMTYSSEYHDEDVKINLGYYVQIMMRQLWIIIVTVVLVTAIAVEYTRRQTPIYSATVTMIINSKNDDFSVFTPQYGQGRTTLRNQLEIIKSKRLMKKVKSNLEEKVADDRVYNLPIMKNLSNESQILNMISVSQKRDTDIIELTVKSSDPDEAQILANVIAEAYEEESINITRAEVSRMREFLGEQLEIMKLKLVQSEEALRNFKEEGGFVSLDTETSSLVNELSTFEAQSKQAQTELKAAQQRLVTLRSQLSENQASLETNIDDISTPLINQLRKEMVAKQTTLSSLLADGYSEEHPEIISLKNQIQDNKTQLKEELRKAIQNKNISYDDPLGEIRDLLDQILSLEVEIETLMAKKDAIDKIVTEYKTRLTTIPDQALRLAQIERAVQVNEKVYMLLVEKFEEAKIKEAGEIGNVTIIDKAELPKHPISPKKRTNYMFGVMIGLALGLGIAFLREYFDDSLKTIEDMVHIHDKPCNEEHLQGPIGENAQDGIPDVIGKP